MKRREFLNLGAVAALSGSLAACSSDGNTDQPAPTPTPPEADQPKVVVGWNQTVLEAIRIVKPGPPMVARSLAILHTAMYDAWAAYDGVAIGTRLHNLLRQPTAARTGANKTMAMSYAAYLVLVNQYPTEKPRFDAKMVSLGFAVAPTIVDATRPEGVGNLAAQAILDYRRGDGSNQDGSLSASGLPYSDYTGYVPANAAAVFNVGTPLSGIAFPGRWQPITYFDATGTAKTPGFIGPHRLKGTPFALTSASQFRRKQWAHLNSPIRHNM